MIHVRWVDRITKSEPGEVRHYIEGLAIGAWREKGKTFVTVKCTDGHVRDVPAEKIIP